MFEHVLTSVNHGLLKIRTYFLPLVDPKTRPKSFPIVYFKRKVFSMRTQQIGCVRSSCSIDQNIVLLFLYHRFNYFLHKLKYYEWLASSTIWYIMVDIYIYTIWWSMVHAPSSTSLVHIMIWFMPHPAHL